MSRQDPPLFPEDVPAGAGAARLRQVLHEKERRDRARMQAPTGPAGQHDTRLVKRSA